MSQEVEARVPFEFCDLEKFSIIQLKPMMRRTEYFLPKLLKWVHDLLAPTWVCLIERMSSSSCAMTVTTRMPYQKKRVNRAVIVTAYLCIPILPPSFGIGPTNTVPPTKPVISVTAVWNCFRTDPSWSNPLRDESWSNCR
jgi:hypothetical protein